MTSYPVQKYSLKSAILSSWSGTTPCNPACAGPTFPTWPRSSPAATALTSPPRSPRTPSSARSSSAATSVSLAGNSGKGFRGCLFFRLYLSRIGCGWLRSGMFYHFSLSAKFPNQGRHWNDQDLNQPNPNPRGDRPPCSISLLSLVFSIISPLSQFTNQT